VNALLIEHMVESQADVDLEPGTYLETDVILPRKKKHAMEAWLRARGRGNITFWEPARGGYRLSIHSKSKNLLPAVTKAAEKL